MTSPSSPLLFGPELLLLQITQRREGESDEGGRNEEIRRKRLSRKRKKHWRYSNLWSRMTAVTKQDYNMFSKGTLLLSEVKLDRNSQQIWTM